MTKTALELLFHQELLDSIAAARQLGYNPTYFAQMVGDLGGVGAARQLLASSGGQEGFLRLFQLHRLDLSLEAAVLDPRYATLFTITEKREAKKRLDNLGYKQAKSGLQATERLDR